MCPEFWVHIRLVAHPYTTSPAHDDRHAYPEEKPPSLLRQKTHTLPLDCYSHDHVNHNRQAPSRAPSPPLPTSCNAQNAPSSHEPPAPPTAAAPHPASKSCRETTSHRHRKKKTYPLSCPTTPHTSTFVASYHKV